MFNKVLDTSLSAFTPRKLSLVDFGQFEWEKLETFDESTLWCVLIKLF